MDGVLGIELLALAVDREVILARIVAEKTKYTPQNVGRRLRELENEGTVEVRYEKNHAYYRFKTGENIADKIRRQLAWFETLSTPNYSA